MTEKATVTLDLAILCGGRSRRLGQPKQHVTLGHQTLLEQTVRRAAEFRDRTDDVNRLIFISGAYLQQDCTALIESGLSELVSHHYNAQWRDGMATSAACALQASEADALMLLLVDQYAVNSDDLKLLHQAWRTSPLQPVAAAFEDTIGPPVIWPRAVLHRQAGQHPGNATEPQAASINKQALLSANPITVALKNATRDIDTPDDLTAARAYLRASASDA